MTIDITVVRSGRDLRTFVDVPWQLYGDRYPQWAPPLRMAVRESVDAKKNPFYRRATRELFLAHRDGHVVGRIGAIENLAHNEFHNDRVGFFGFFECVNDQAVADALFAAASGWLRGRGLTVMRGPMNPSINHECGLLVDGFDQHPTIMTTWNPPYYAELIERAGFVKAKDLFAFVFRRVGPDANVLPPRYAAIAEHAVARGNVKFRSMDQRHFDREIAISWDIYNDAWQPNWGFVPMTRDEFVYSAKELRFLLWPEVAIIAEVDGKPAGVMINVPDYAHAFRKIGNGRLFPTGLFKLLRAKKTLKSLRIMVLGVKAEHRTRGIYALFVYELLRRGQQMGIEEGEASWILEDNPAMIHPLRAVGMRKTRTWRIYDRPVSGADSTAMNA